MTNRPPFENRARDIPPESEQAKVRELQESLQLALDTVKGGRPWSVTALTLINLQPRVQQALDATISPYWRYRPVVPPTDDPTPSVPDSPEGLT